MEIRFVLTSMKSSLQDKVQVVRVNDVRSRQLKQLYSSCLNQALIAYADDMLSHSKS